MKEKLFYTAVPIISIIFSLLAFEVSLRAYHGEWEYKNFRFPEGLLTRVADFDAELGWIPKRGVWRSHDGWVATTIEDGIRSNGGGEVPDPTETILAVGDSFTFGDQVSDRETWPAQLEKLSERRVINGGVFAYGIDQAFLRARRLLNRYRVNTIIFSFIYADVGRCQMSVIHAHKPYFDFKDGRLTLENVPLPPPVRPPEKESALLVALEHSRLAHAIMIRLFPEWWFKGQTSLEQVLDEENGRMVACALLHELEGLAKSHGSELIILVQRTNAETVSGSIDIERALGCLSDPGTRVLDLRPAISELKAKDPSRYDRFYLPPGGHMSAEGNQFVARELLQILTQSVNVLHVVPASAGSAELFHEPSEPAPAR